MIGFNQLLIRKHQLSLRFCSGGISKPRNSYSETAKRNTETPQKKNFFLNRSTETP